MSLWSEVPGDKGLPCPKCLGKLGFSPAPNGSIIRLSTAPARHQAVGRMESKPQQALSLYLTAGVVRLLHHPQLVQGFAPMVVSARPKD